MSNRSAFAVAAYVNQQLTPASPWGENENPTNKTKTLKLLYFLQGHYLAITGKPFFQEKIEAWPRGPVVREVWEQWGAIEQEKEKPELSANALSFINQVLERYPSSAQALIIETHKEGSPWDKVYVKGKNAEVGLELLKETFTREMMDQTSTILEGMLQLEDADILELKPLVHSKAEYIELLRDTWVSHQIYLQTGSWPQETPKSHADVNKV